MSVDLLAGAFAGLGGMALIWATLRFIAPLTGRFVGSVWKVKVDLDADRDRIIANLRAEVVDKDRRIADLVNRVALSEAECRSNVDALKKAEDFIERYMKRPRAGT